MFFAAADPGEDPGPAWTAYHFATVAAGADLDAEVRLAGDAVKVALPGGIIDAPRGLQLRAQVAAGATAGFDVTL